MEYRVIVVTSSIGIADDCASKLVQIVNEALKNGWKPQGGVSVTRSDLEVGPIHKIVMTQALIKE